MRSEFQFINDIKKRFSLTHIGDDCAVLPKDAELDLLITTDLLIENIDFRLDWATPRDIGYKSLAVSLSDIAAMGGTPTHALISLGVPENLWKGRFLDEFYEGWHSLANEFQVELIGGDVSSVPGKLVIDSIVLGEVLKDKALLRSGAKAGDQIYVSGTLGGAAAGLRILEAPNSKKSDKLIQKQLRPVPQVALGKQLRKLGIVNAMIDISDGLSSDIRHICEASGVGAIIEADHLPIDSQISADLFENDNLLEFALNGGEDFGLLFTTTENNESLAGNLPITNIGTVTNTGKVEIKNGDKVQELSPGGFRHF
jgi:thiamine-monophosphate kinase